MSPGRVASKMASEINGILGAAVVIACSWFVWVTVSVFKLTQQIALMTQQIELIKREIEVLYEVKKVLLEINRKLDGPLRGELKP